MSSKPANSFQMVFPAGLAVGFDRGAFDDAVRSQGTVFVHYKALRCPAGLIDKSDIRQPHEDHLGCSNGFLYRKAGDVTLLFSGNGHQVRGFDAGVMDSSTVQVTIPTTYDGTDDFVYAVPYDRFYLKHPEGVEPLVVPNWELVQQHATGYDRLQFPAVKVTDCIDSAGHEYSQDVDFEVTPQGQIHWLGQRRPGIDPGSGKGRIFTCRYLYRPHWYLQRMLHEVRISQIDNPATGERTVERFAQAALLQREYIFIKDLNDPQSTGSEDPQRQVRAPENGSFGPR